MSKMNYTEFIRPFEKNLKRVSIIFNDGGRREQIEEQLTLLNDENVDPSTVRKVPFDTIKSDWSDNIKDNAKFLRYEISTTYQNANKNSLQRDFKKVHRFDSLADLYQPMDQDLFSIFPRVDITDHIYLMGDYFSNDFESMKAYTEFKIKINWLEI